MFISTSRRRSPSTLYSRSISSRRRLTSSSVKFFTRVSGLMRAFSRIFLLVVKPMPKMYVSEISTRLSRGMSTPAILAIFSSSLAAPKPPPGPRTGGDKPSPYSDPCGCLALPLFMLWIFTTDNHDHAIAPDHFTVFAAWFHRCAYFHDLPSSRLRKKFRMLARGYKERRTSRYTVSTSLSAIRHNDAH